jgi:hypothetical protein
MRDRIQMNEEWGHHFQNMEEYQWEIKKKGRGENDSQVLCVGQIEEMHGMLH